MLYEPTRQQNKNSYWSDVFKYLCIFFIQYPPTRTSSFKVEYAAELPTHSIVIDRYFYVTGASYVYHSK